MTTVVIYGRLTKELHKFEDIARIIEKIQCNVIANIWREHVSDILPAQTNFNKQDFVLCGLKGYLPMTALPDR